MEEKYRDRKVEPKRGRISDRRGEKSFSKIRPVDRDKDNVSISQTSKFENSITHVPAKKINSEFAQTFPLSCTPMTRNEFIGSFKCIHINSVSDTRDLSCRSIAEDVDEVDYHCR